MNSSHLLGSYVLRDEQLITLLRERKETVWVKVAVLSCWRGPSVQVPGASEAGAFSLLFIIQLSCKTHVKLPSNRIEESPLGREVRSALGSCSTLHEW